MLSIDDIAAEYVERAAALDPCYATYAWTSGCTWNWMSQGAPAGARASAGMPRSPGSFCAPTPAGMNGNCAPSYVAASACRVRPPHTSLVNGSGYRPGRTPWHGPEE